MTSAWSQLEQMLTCAICLDKFKNPRLLPCQHSFCGDACMEGLVDYARRQIKCPECRAEHRIPYQGVGSLPTNVTLIRFLELHSRITGEEPEPVPTFMEKCSVCGEKLDGVQRCAHCDKKVCPECKAAHVDLLRREIARINTQTKRSLGRLEEFRDSLERCKERLLANQKSVCWEIEESSRRLVEDLQSKQRHLLAEVNGYVEQELATLDKLRAGMKGELACLESNAGLADERFSGRQTQSDEWAWSDQELSEAKEVFARAMEFARLFDPDLGDFNRRIRFNLLPDFDALRKRICELGELRFTESSLACATSALQYSNATGQLAVELTASQAARTAASVAGLSQLGAYGLAHSTSNSNLAAGPAPGAGRTLELPMSSALMRSQSDHRLAAQFQQHLKQQQQQHAGRASSKAGQRAGEGGESRYAQLTSDWPRPGDSDEAAGFTAASGFQFKSAFMRRREKERQMGTYGGAHLTDDDDEPSPGELASAAGRVRFSHQLESGGESAAGLAAPAPKVFDCSQLEHAPFSGVPRLESSPYLELRLHQMGARAAVEKRAAAEEGRRDEALAEAARLSGGAAKAAAPVQRQASEDEIEKQKRANKQQKAGQEAANSVAGAEPDAPDSPVSSASAVQPQQQQQQQQLQQPLPSQAQAQPPSQPQPTTTRPAQPEAAPSSSTASGSALAPGAAVPGGRRSLYGQAVTEKSRRQLSSAALQEACSSGARRRAGGARDLDSPDSSPGSSSAAAERRRRQLARQLDSSSRSSAASLDLAEASAHLSAGPKNWPAGSGGSRALGGRQASPATGSQRPGLAGAPLDSRGSSSAPRFESGRRASGRRNRSATATTDDEDDEGEEDDDDDEDVRDVDGDADDDDEQREADTDEERARRRRQLADRRSARSAASELGGRARAGAPTSTSTSRFLHRLALSPGSKDTSEDEAGASSRNYRNSNNRGRNNNDHDEDDNDDDDHDDGDDDGERTPVGEDTGASARRRNLGNRSSREFLPNAVNKLLDRSAQIRRDSQEQRSRADSPPRAARSRGLVESASTRELGAGAGWSKASYLSAGSSALPLSVRQRLAYQSSRSSSRDDELAPDNEPAGSSKSTGAGRRASAERTARASAIGHSYRLADSLGGGSSETPPKQPFQSRFLSRSSTAASLASGAADNGRRSQAQDKLAGGQDNGSSRATSSRDPYESLLGSRARAAYTTGAQTSGAPSSGASYLASGSGTGSQELGAAAQESLQPEEEWGAIAGQREPIEPRECVDCTPNKAPSVQTQDFDGSRGVQTSGGSKSGTPFGGGNRNEPTSSGESMSDDEDDYARDTLSGPDDSKGAHKSDSYGPETHLLDEKSNQQRVWLQIGRPGSQPGQFAWPRGLALGGMRASGAEILVADSSNHRIQVLDLQGGPLLQLGSYGSLEGQFDCPAGVAANERLGRYVASDRYNHRAQIFDRQGRFLAQFGELGAGRGQLNVPWGVACDATRGLIYVCERDNHRVQVFDSLGAPIRLLGWARSASGQRAPALLGRPHYIALGPRGELAVADTANHRVRVFDPRGSATEALLTFGREGSQLGELRFPRGLAWDGQAGALVVADSANNRVQIFDVAGEPIEALGSPGSGPAEFRGVEGVAVNEATGDILACDRENHRIQVLASGRARAAH